MKSAHTNNVRKNIIDIIDVIIIKSYTQDQPEQSFLDFLSPPMILFTVMHLYAIVIHIYVYGKKEKVNVK